MSNDPFEKIHTYSRDAAHHFGSYLLEKVDREQVVPELSQAYLLAIENPEYVWKRFFRYMQLIQQLVHLLPEDLRLITRANEIIQGNAGDSSSRATIQDFFEELTLERIPLLTEYIRSATNILEEDSNAALIRMTSMMHDGHIMFEEMRASGVRPSDNDPRWESVIWGQTQIDNPVGLIDFTICHYIERYMSIVFQQLGIEIARHKDWFLNLLTDMLVLNFIRHNARFKDIFELWKRPKSEGGLGWISQRRIDAFEEATQ